MMPADAMMSSEPLCSVAQIRHNILALKQESNGLLGKIIGHDT